MTCLMLVEDDELLRDALGAQLRAAGHTVLAWPDAEQAQRSLAQQPVDALLLDLGLPGASGLDLLRWLRPRQPALPVLILTARDGLDDRVGGLRAGADDYLTKPFATAELLARLAALLRRARLPAFDAAQTQAPDNGLGLRLDAQQPLVWVGAQRVELTAREAALLGLLIERQGQVVSREDVLAVWQRTAAEPPAQAATGSNALEVYVHRLRRKLADAPLHIRNVRGLGYLLEARAPAA